MLMSYHQNMGQNLNIRTANKSLSHISVNPTAHFIFEGGLYLH